ncbi:MAG: hypothetical protein WA985_07165, partial [Erythrobacter sp.]
PAQDAAPPTPARARSESSVNDTEQDAASEDEAVGPGFESLPLPSDESSDLPTAALPEQDIAAPTDGSDIASSEPALLGDEGSYDTTRRTMMGLIVLVLLALVGLGWMAWRRRSRGDADETVDASSLIANVNQSIAERMPPMMKGSAAKSRATTKPAASGASAASAEKPRSSTPQTGRGAAAVGTAPATGTPPRLDCALDIASASCSVMMLTIECRITIANRSDFAARDLAVQARLHTVRPRDANARVQEAGEGAAHSSGEAARGDIVRERIERIGPQQSHRLSVRLQIPVRGINAIRQGNRPIFIPLATIDIEGAGEISLSREFVIGSPSAVNASRLHPLPLDVPPGGIHDLRAQPIRHANAGETATRPGMATA